MANPLFLEALLVKISRMIKVAKGRRKEKLLRKRDELRRAYHRARGMKY